MSFCYWVSIVISPIDRFYYNPIIFTKLITNNLSNLWCFFSRIFAGPPTDENKSDGPGNNPSRSNADKMQSDSTELTTTATSSATLAPQLQQPQHSNIYLVRGARTENGHLILQNSHELLSLLNDDDKSIILQHPRIQTKSGIDGAGGGTILFHQPTMKATTTTESSILLQTQTIKKTSAPGEGSIILQQRLNKTGGTDGPILLQTLKRLDKSQPILFFRSANTTTTTATTTIAQHQQQQQQQQQQKKQQLLRQQQQLLQQQGVVGKKEDGGGGGDRSEPQPQKQANIPLGSGELNFIILPFKVFQKMKKKSVWLDLLG